MSCGCDSGCGCSDGYLPIWFEIFPKIVTGQPLPEIQRLTIDGQETILTRVFINFKSDPSSLYPNFTLDSDNGDITITESEPETWGFTINSFTVDLPADSYFYQLWTEDSTSAKRCWITEEWTISTSI